MEDILFAIAVGGYLVVGFAWPTLRVWRRYDVWPIVFDRESAPAQRLLGILTGTLLAGLLVLGGLHVAVGSAALGVWLLPTPVRAAGWLALLCGGVLTVVAQRQMGASWRVGIDDRLSGRRLVGLGIGFLGVVALVGLDISGSSLWAVVAMIITVIGYSLGPIIVDRRLSDLPSLAIIACAMTINAVIYAPWALLTWPTEPIPASAWVSVLVLGSICSALAFIIFFALIAEVGPSRTTLITYINPVVAVALGVIVLAEPLTIGLAVGLPLVLLGSWMATRKGPALEAEPHA